MPKFKVKGQTVQAGEHQQRDKQNGWTDRQTDATKHIISPALRSIITVDSAIPERAKEKISVPILNWSTAVS